MQRRQEVRQTYTIMLFNFIHVSTQTFSDEMKSDCYQER